MANGSFIDTNFVVIGGKNQGVGSEVNEESPDSVSLSRSI